MTRPRRHSSARAGRGWEGRGFRRGRALDRRCGGASPSHSPSPWAVPRRRQPPPPPSLCTSRSPRRRCGRRFRCLLRAGGRRRQSLMAGRSPPSGPVAAECQRCRGRYRRYNAKARSVRSARLVMLRTSALEPVSFGWRETDGCVRIFIRVGIVLLECASLLPRRTLGWRLHGRQ